MLIRAALCQLTLLTALVTVVTYGQLPQAFSAKGHRDYVGSASPHSASHHSTFLYGLTSSDVPGNSTFQYRSEILAFRLRRDGRFVAIPLKGNLSGDLGNLQFITASPNGRFLFAECKNTDADGNYRPFFLQYRILPSGQLKPDGRYGETDTPGATHLVFHPSGRYAYLSWPDQSSSQSQPGQVVQIRVRSKGDPDFTPVASVPCGPMPTALALDSQGKVGGVLDAETGFLWQYTFTSQGRLQPIIPSSTPVVKQIFAPLITGDGQFMYVANEPNHQHYRIYQLHRNAGGGFSLLTPWAVRVPDAIYSVVMSNKHRVVYVSSGPRLMSFRISRKGMLQPGTFSMKTVVGVNMVVDEETDCLYVLGLHNMLRAYRILDNGALTALGKAPAHASVRMNDLTIVHR